MSDRPITHVMPIDDGYDHDLEDCACGPTIVEADGAARLGEKGRTGALTFSHHAMESSGRWRILEEVDGDVPDAPNGAGEAQEGSQ